MIQITPASGEQVVLLLEDEAADAMTKILTLYPEAQVIERVNLMLTSLINEAHEAELGRISKAVRDADDKTKGEVKALLKVS